jgi:hypothetical protein
MRDDTMKNIDDLVFKVCYMVAIGSFGGRSIRCKNQIKSLGLKMGLLWAAHSSQLLANFHPKKKCWKRDKKKI